MSRLLCALYFLALFPFAANATSISSSSIVNSNCSGTLTSSLLDGASFACAGNFKLDGGSITSDSVINISADGDLFLDNLTLTAPNVNLSNLTGMLNIGNSVVINTPITVNENAPKSILSWSDFSLSQGDTVNFNVGRSSGGSTELSKVDISTGSLSLGHGGSLYLGNTNGVIYPEAIDTPIVGGALVISSGSDVNLLISDAVMLSKPAAFSVASIPEPGTYAFMLLGLGLILLRQKV